MKRKATPGSTRESNAQRRRLLKFAGVRLRTDPRQSRRLRPRSGRLEPQRVDEFRETSRLIRVAEQKRRDLRREKRRLRDERRAHEADVKRVSENIRKRQAELLLGLAEQGLEGDSQSDERRAHDLKLIQEQELRDFQEDIRAADIIESDLPFSFSDDELLEHSTPEDTRSIQERFRWGVNNIPVIDGVSSRLGRTADGSMVVHGIFSFRIVNPATETLFRVRIRYAVSTIKTSGFMNIKLWLPPILREFNGFFYTQILYFFNVTSTVDDHLTSIALYMDDGRVWSSKKMSLNGRPIFSVEAILAALSSIWTVISENRQENYNENFVKVGAYGQSTFTTGVKVLEVRMWPFGFLRSNVTVQDLYERLQGLERTPLTLRAAARKQYADIIRPIN